MDTWTTSYSASYVCGASSYAQQGGGMGHTARHAGMRSLSSIYQRLSQSLASHRLKALPPKSSPDNDRDTASFLQRFFRADGTEDLVGGKRVSKRL